MTTVLLLKALKSFIVEKCTDYSLDTKVDSVFVPPSVFLGFLPVKYAEDKFPNFIILRPTEGEDSRDIATVKIKIIIGTYSKADEGFFDCLNILQRVRDKLFEQRIIDDRYRIEYPFTWQLFEDQPYPQWQVEATAIFTVPQMLEITNKIDEYFT